MKKPKGIAGIKVTIKPMSNKMVANAAKKNPKLAAAIGKTSAGASAATTGALKPQKVSR